MRRGTTPTVSVKVPDLDLTGWTVYLTFEWRGGELTKKGADLSIASDDGGCTVSTVLTQAETLAWESGTKVSVQIRATDGTRAIATKVDSFPVDRVLMEGVI